MYIRYNQELHLAKQLLFFRKIFFFCSFATLLTCLWIDVNYTYDVTYSNKINYFQQKETKDGKGNLSSMVFNETIRQQLKTALKLASQEKVAYRFNYILSNFHRTKDLLKVYC